MPKLHVSADTYQRLIGRITSWGETPDTILERLLDATEASHPGRPPLRPRRNDGRVVPETDFLLPILQALEEAGGSARVGDVLDAVELKVRDRLTPMDFDRLGKGDIRWRSRARFASSRLKDAGYLEKDPSTRTWTITERGQDCLAQLSTEVD